MSRPPGLYAVIFSAALYVGMCIATTKAEVISLFCDKDKGLWR
jgi:hypothetical protein